MSLGEYCKKNSLLMSWSIKRQRKQIQEHFADDSVTKNIRWQSKKMSLGEYCKRKNSLVMSWPLNLIKVIVLKLIMY